VERLDNGPTEQKSKVDPVKKSNTVGVGQARGTRPRVETKGGKKKVPQGRKGKTTNKTTKKRGASCKNKKKQGELRKK